MIMSLIFGYIWAWLLGGAILGTIAICLWPIVKGLLYVAGFILVIVILIAIAKKTEKPKKTERPKTGQPDKEFTYIPESKNYTKKYNEFTVVPNDFFDSVK